MSILWRGVFERTARTTASEDRWQAGISYHSGDQAKSATSVSTDELEPFEIRLRRPGPSWVFLAVVAHDESGDEIGFHGIWQNLFLHSSSTFDPLTVQVDGANYRVSAEADEDGMVTTSVTSAANADEEVDSDQRDKAIYAAGVRLQTLDGIFDRPSIAALPVTSMQVPFSLASPSSNTLLKAFGNPYSGAVVESGLAETLSAGEAISPIAVEALTPNMADAP